ncbi:class I SAM-dependent methyltransferase [Aliidiomarina indica]|uniref:class I SAM-dependent methyltransferase n=1 Tax=Aliidiomarina indica TaxID=2749147 RepID=UPI00188E9C65|nr:class I SAM-dependent methyltransferase [Aliidiomarina indica]
MSIDYYNKNAHAFDFDTAEVDMAPLYQEFLPLLPAGAHIVDAGCGTGRDALAFQAQGFRVTAFDASEALVTIAKQRLGSGCVQQTAFLDFSVKQPADAMWACASLLHVPFSELPKTFSHLADQLKRGGLFYCSFKYGDHEVEREGRTFTNMNEARLQKVIADSDLSPTKVWISNDARPHRDHDRWLNAVLVKKE